MIKVHNSHSLNLVNHECKFISSLLLTHPKGLLFDVDLKVSHSRFPLSWNSTPANVKYVENEIRIDFFRPNNYFNYRVDVYGLEASLITGSLVHYESNSTSDVLANIKQKSITFAAPVRNCGSSLKTDIELAMRIGAYFKDYMILIFENDSIDNTKSILSDFNGNSNIKIFSQDGLDSYFPYRTQRISFARNFLFNEIKKRDSDYFCNMDMDGIIGNDFSFEGFLSNFYFDECWDAVFPANVDKYYDIWALRHESICPGDYQRKMNAMSPTFSNETIFDHSLNNLQSMDFKKLNGWLSVFSAFGGMGIYKTSKFLNSNYFGVEDGYEACEHVNFHLKAVETGATLYINPHFLVNSKVGL